MQIVIGIFIGVVIGFCFGFLIAAICSVSRVSATRTIKHFENVIDHERTSAINEKQSPDYINGISSILALYRLYFEEELEDERLQEKN